MNLGKMFSRSAASRSGTKKVTRCSRVEGETLKGALDKDYKKVSALTMLPTKCACEEFLPHNGLQEDFITMVQGSGMEVFSSLDVDTYKHATWEFLDLYLLRQPHHAPLIMHCELYT
jgi:hypothetical protein